MTKRLSVYTSKVTLLLWRLASRLRYPSDNMDPLTAIGLVGNILAFIDFGVGLLNSVREIHDASHRTLDENTSRETVVREMKLLSSHFLTPEYEASCNTKDATPLRRLSKECYGISAQLLALLEKIKPKDPDSKRQSFLSALRNKKF